MEAQLFQWQDYVVLTIVLAISACIGFYYAFTGGKQKTTKEYLFADMNMHWLPVSCSLLASYLSSLTIMSTPGEVYSYGTILMYGNFFVPIGIVIASKLFLPVFQQMKMVSVYKGGMKAVLMTDTLQLLLVFAGLMTMVIAGTISAGGPAEVYKANKISGRLDILEPEKFLAADPRTRHTLWNMGFGLTVTGIIIYGTTQTSVMRALSLRPAHRIGSYMATAGMWCAFEMLSAALGLIIFAAFRYCDPIEEGVIFTKDQYYPLFVMRLFGHLPGLPGFILSAVFSGSHRTGFSAIFDISYRWVTFGGILVSMITACVASVIFNHFDSEPEKVNHLLISPHVIKSSILPKSWRAHIDFTDDLLEEEKQNSDIQDGTTTDTSSQLGSSDWIKLQEKTS